MPTIEQVQALKQLKQSATTQHVDVMELAGHHTPPDDIKDILGAQDARSPAQRLKSKCEQLDTAKLNNESSYPKAPGFRKIENWASGNSPPFHRFKDEPVLAWFETLFELVAAQSQSLLAEGGIRLSRNDLFHGHVVLDTASEPSADLLIIFHAKEYPLDIEPGKCGFARELEPNVPTFETGDQCFKGRNPIWSLKHSKIWSIKYTTNNNPFRVLLGDPDVSADGNPLFLDSAVLGTCLADINYFPTEGVRPFLKLWNVG